MRCLSLILLCITPLAASAANRVGDAENDSDVDMMDVGRVQARIYGTIDEWSISPLALADADGDLDLKDLMLVGQAALGLRTIAGRGGWLSLTAIQLTKVGVASTLMALPPIFLLPISHFVFKEQLGWAAILGTVVAMVGVAILFIEIRN